MSSEETHSNSPICREPGLGLEDRFRYHAPSVQGVARHAQLTAEFLVLADAINEICPPGREKALVLTKLEEAKFWASAAVARNPDTR